MIVKHEQSISHLRRAAGKDSPLVYRSRQGVTDAYERPAPVNPNTSDQQLSRQAWSRSCAAWKELSAEAKAEWNHYGATHRHNFPERRSAEPLTGYRLFQAAAGNRQILGLALPTSAPSLLPPEVPTRVELLPSAEADTLRLRIEHKLQGEAFRVAVSMSPATVRVSRKPDRRAGRHVRGWGQASTAPLPESGGEIVFSNCRYAVEPGRRFGIWLRMIRESDGLASPELFLDFVRPEPEPFPGPAATGGDSQNESVGSSHPPAALHRVVMLIHLPRLVQTALGDVVFASAVELRCTRDPDRHGAVRNGSAGAVPRNVERLPIRISASCGVVRRILKVFGEHLEGPDSGTGLRRGPFIPFRMLSVSHGRKDKTPESCSSSLLVFKHSVLEFAIRALARRGSASEMGHSAETPPETLENHKVSPGFAPPVSPPVNPPASGCV